MRNQDGSFYDFVAERFTGTDAPRRSTTPGDDWGARGITAWARRAGRRPTASTRTRRDEFERLAGVLDGIYEAGR